MNKVRDCNNCKKELEKQIQELKSWETKKKMIIEKWIEENEHTSCSDCPNFNKVDLKETEKTCSSCDKKYQLKENDYYDVEPNKHECSQQPSKQPNKDKESSLSGGLIVIIVSATLSLLLMGFLIQKLTDRKNKN